jgi:radical SAM superfamily enzyme YgiQ (UPF0313 family)
VRICLIRCPSPFLIEDGIVPPLGLMAVGTGLKQKGHDVFIHDRGDDIPLDFDYYGLGPTTPEYGYALSIREKIKKHTDAKIVIGGPYATLNPEECLKDGFDCVVAGDGEIVSEDAFKSGKNIIVGPEKPLDEYPIIDRALINPQEYKYYLNDRLSTTVVSGRGCPYKCAFCCKNHSSVRLRSAGKVIEEIKYLNREFGYNAIMFPEDIFIRDKLRAEAVFKYMGKAGIISRCLVRADVVVRHGKDFTALMANSGCIEVGMGVESGSDTILKNVNKGESVSTIKKAVRMIKRAGIRIKGFFIVGLPGESLTTLAETKKFLDEMCFDDVDIKIFQPYPGSPIWDNRQEYDIQWHNGVDYKNMFYKGRPKEYYGNVCTSSLTSEQIVSEWINMEATYKGSERHNTCA